MNHALLIALTVALPIAAPWLPGRARTAVALLGAGLLSAAGLAWGVLAPSALAAVLALYGLAWSAGRQSNTWRPAALALFMTLALAIALGALPGFASLPLSASLPIKAASQPYTLTVNPGKALITIALLLWLVPLSRTASAWKRLRDAPLATLATAGLVLAMAWALGHIQPAPGLPPLPFTLAWGLVNLLLVCTLEEAFFRGLLQRALGQQLPAAVAIALAAGLFGLAHLPGGVVLASLATLAGLGYGWVYQRTGQCLEAAIACHFAVNALHLALFTYPATLP